MSAPVLHIVGARPNFMKVAPLLRALRATSAEHEHLLVHTGQHYDAHLNDSIFRDLQLPEPDVHLGAGSGTHAEQTGRIMVAFEKLVVERRPAMVVVAGDVNSTLACSVVAAKANVPVAHLEAGLRSGDWTMPEEINRIVTDRLTSLHLTPSPDGDENLLREGVKPESIVRIGNCMIDSLRRFAEVAARGDALRRFEVEPGRFILATLHRPSNVDAPEQLARLVQQLAQLGSRLPVVFPVHPRTRARLEAARISFAELKSAHILLSEPLGYLDFVQLEQAAAVVITDSGGVQEETTALGVPCLTLRDNTERPITITEGTNKLVGSNPSRLPQEVELVLAGEGKRGSVPALWDGRAGERGAEAIRAFLSAHRN